MENIMAAAEKKKKDVKEDAEDENEKEGEGQPEKKGSKLKLIIIIVVVVALLGGGGAAAYFIFFKAKSQTADKKQEAKPLIAVFLPMDPFIVNLIDNEGERYLKVVMQLELSDQLMLEDVKKINPKIRDAILELLAAKTYKEMIDPLGKQKLRDEIAMRTNLLINSPKGKVVKVYFTEFVIQ
jgi:flagellar protein FliL